VLAKQLGLTGKPVNGSNGANLGFEAKMWTAADKLRNNMDAAEYKHVVLGLIFLKYISDVFSEVYDELLNDPEKLSDPEDKDEYKARNVFWVPAKARWDTLQRRSRLLRRLSRQRKRQTSPRRPNPENNGERAG
jgi:type I restriction enzyme M protein